MCVKHLTNGLYYDFPATILGFAHHTFPSRKTTAADACLSLPLTFSSKQRLEQTGTQGSGQSASHNFVPLYELISLATYFSSGLTTSSSSAALLLRTVRPLLFSRPGHFYIFGLDPLPFSLLSLWLVATLCNSNAHILPSLLDASLARAARSLSGISQAT
ncbi:hypothetical protein VTG60DRAFT_151 [Thermothelomyces hinnuleus]